MCLCLCLCVGGGGRRGPGGGYRKKTQHRKVKSRKESSPVVPTDARTRDLPVTSDAP